MAPKYLLSKDTIQEGVQHIPPAGTQGQGLQQDGEEVQGDRWESLLIIVQAIF